LVENDQPTYHHNPQIDRLAIDTAWLPDAPLRLRAEGSNQDFEVAYEMQRPPPRDRQARLHVTQTDTATANVEIDPTRQAEFQGFKLVRLDQCHHRSQSGQRRAVAPRRRLVWVDLA